MTLQFVTQAQSEVELTIFAASSLTEVFTDLEETFEAAHDVQITVNFAGSSTLAAQIIQGASADIFASANQEQIQIVVDEGLIEPDTVEVFAENELVVIVPRDNPANIQTAQDLSTEDVLLVVTAPSVPIREYTDILLHNLTDYYGDTFPDSVIANIVSEEPNVRQVATRVALGEADVGIVYRTDVTSDIMAMVQIVELPENTSPRASYPIAPLINTEFPGEASEFISFVMSDEGQSILQSWGFCLPTLVAPEATLMPEITVEPTLELEETPEAHVTRSNC